MRSLERSVRTYIAIGILTLAAGLISLSTVRYVRATSLPVPTVSSVDIILGNDNIVQWGTPLEKYDSRMLFEVALSTDKEFPSEKTKTQLIDDTVLTVFPSLNKTLFMRVRSVIPSENEFEPNRYGSWSAVSTLELYDSVINRIERTKILKVAMERSYGRSEYRFYETEKSFRSRNKDDAVLRRNGIEVMLAYRLADSLCEKLLRDRRNLAPGEPGGKQKPVVCLPSDPAAFRDVDREKTCRNSVCERIDVQFFSTGWPDVMQDTGKGIYDLAISTITFLPEREDEHNILFSDVTYAQTRHAFVYKIRQPPDAGLTPKAVPLAEFLPGKSIGVQGTTTSGKCLAHIQKHMRDNGLGEFKIRDYKRVVVAFLSLLSEGSPVDYVMTDETFATGWQRHQRGKIAFAVPDETGFGPGAAAFCGKQEYRIAMRSGELMLKTLVDEELRQLIGSGELEKMKEKAIISFENYFSNRLNVEFDE